jgi:hypothetical protein
LIDDFARDIDTVTLRTQNVDDGTAHGALAASGFTNQTQSFTLVKVEAHTIDRPDLGDFTCEHTTRHREANEQILYLQQLFHIQGLGGFTK